MVEKDFNVFPRRRGESAIWYYRVKNHNKEWTSGRSTGIPVEFNSRGNPRPESQTEAEEWVASKLSTKTLALPGDGRTRFGEFASDFWSADSFYVQSRREFGHRLTESHRYNRQRIAEAHLIPSWSNWYLDEIDTVSVKRWLVDYKKNGYTRTYKNGKKKHVSLSPATMNDIRNCFSQMVDHAVAEGLISHNPIKPVPRFHGKPKERGVLSLPELKKLLDPERIGELWPDRRYWLATFIAAGTGLRLGEIRALTARCVGDTYIRVERGWDERAHTWKLPKWDKIRTTPAPSSVIAALHGWIQERRIPPEGWVFPGRRFRDGEGWRQDPLSDFVIRDAYYKALEKVGIGQEQREARNIVFHSLRHSIILLARKGRVDPWQLMKAVGHGDLKVLDDYSDHEVEAAELDAVVRFQASFFGDS
jgi:integrase